MSLFSKIWYQKHPLFYLFIPLSGIYKLALFFKKLLYRFHLKKITYFPVPIIIVGNLTVGGTGKTPLIIMLAQHLAKNGYQPGIVSRGYGGKPEKLPLYVYPNSDPLQAGDEPVLIARKTGFPVVVDPNRVRAVKMLLNNHSCNVVLSDDGLQHTALGRDIEVIVIDGSRRFGNGWCLPAGPLREPVKRLKKADFVVTREKALPGEWSMRFVPEEPYTLKQIEQTKNLLSENTIHAVAGIGNPQAFFDQLRGMGFSIIEHAFPDHHAYTAQDIDFGPNATVIMTEKDAIKCEKFAQSTHWCLPVTADCGSMPDLLLAKLNSLSRRKHHAEIT